MSEFGRDEGTELREEVDPTEVAMVVAICVVVVFARLVEWEGMADEAETLREVGAEEVDGEFELLMDLQATRYSDERQKKLDDGGNELTSILLVSTTRSSRPLSWLLHWWRSR